MVPVSSGRASRVLNYWATSPVISFFFFFKKKSSLLPWCSSLPIDYLACSWSCMSQHTNTDVHVHRNTHRRREGEGEMSMLLESAVLKSKPRDSLIQPRVLPTELLPPSLFLTFTFICASQDCGLQYTFCLNSLVYRVRNLTPGTLKMRFISYWLWIMTFVSGASEVPWRAQTCLWVVRLK